MSEDLEEPSDAADDVTEIVAQVTGFLHHEYLNCACFAMSVLLIILIVYLIVRIKFSPKQYTDYTMNKLTLTPYYTCIVYLMLMSS